MDRRHAEKNALLDTALNNMSHGLMMFDAAQPCDPVQSALPRPLPPAAGRDPAGHPAARGASQLRIAAGTFSGDPDAYCAECARRRRARRDVANAEFATPNGRTIAVVSEPLPHGGWVATHQDITEERRREASFRFLFERQSAADVGVGPRDVALPRGEQRRGGEIRLRAASTSSP